MIPSGKTPVALSLSQALAFLRAPKDRDRMIILPGGPAEPIALREAWRANPDMAEGLHLCALFLPGVNEVDYTALAANVTLDLFLASPANAPAIAAGRARVHPIPYSAIPAWLAKAAVEKLAVVQVSPPDAQGLCSLGVCADIGETALAVSATKLALINPHMPCPPEAPRISLSAFDAYVEVDAPLATLRAETPVGAALAAHVAEYVGNGAVIQVGIGRAPSAVLQALRGREGLRFHGGLIGPGHLALAQAGCVADASGALTGGIALGDEPFYRAIAAHRHARFAAIAHTHGHATLSALPAFTAINAVLEVDLFGQTNAEFAGPRWISCVGGLSDFARAARASPGGKSLMMVQALGKDGASRIVPRLSSPCITTARADAGVFISEYGAADVGDLDVQRRAHAIAALAAPEHRAGLLSAWRAL